MVLDTRNSSWWSNVCASRSTKWRRLMDARLHTATSSGAEYWITSVHRLLERIVPRFFWFDLLLHASL